MLIIFLWLEYEDTEIRFALTSVIRRFNCYLTVHLFSSNNFARIYITSSLHTRIIMNIYL